MLAAAKALAAIGTPDCVAALCKQAANESGRLAAEMGRLLFELTGGPYGENGKLWAAWWEREGADFKPISPAELRQHCMSLTRSRRCCVNMDGTEVWGIHKWIRE